MLAAAKETDRGEPAVIAVAWGDICQQPEPIGVNKRQETLFDPFLIAYTDDHRKNFKYAIPAHSWAHHGVMGL